MKVSRFFAALSVLIVVLVLVLSVGPRHVRRAAREAWRSARAAAQVVHPQPVMMEAAQAAFGDFNSEGCETAADGPSAELYVMVERRWLRSACRNASGWPKGAETRRLLSEIRRHVPDALQPALER